jgi:citrate lyase subunit beta/citryl-CoA lyase
VIRSALFVPAHRDGWVEKAVAAGPDAVILDLEDAVPAGEKERARSRVGGAIAALSAAGVVAMARPGEPGDLDACVVDGLDALVLPKIGTVEDVQPYAIAGVGLIVTLETAAGYLAAAELAQAPGVTGLFAATGKGADAQRELGYVPSPSGLETLYVRSHAVLAARAARLPHILSGPWQDLADLDGLRERSAFDRSLGFTGGVLIHPGGVSIVNEAYSPSGAELEYHRSLVEAYEDAERQGVGAIDFRGDHVDAAHYRTSLELLDAARRHGLLDPANEGGR